MIVYRYSIAEHDLERVTVMRDLGVFFDAKLTFVQHIDLTVNQAMRVLGLEKDFPPNSHRFRRLGCYTWR